MNILKSTLVLLLFCTTTAFAAPASETSVKQLLEVTEAQNLIDGMRAQFDSLMNNAIQQSLQGKSPTPQQQQAIDNMRNSMVTIMQGALEWEKLEPMYVRMYKETFTEEEVAGMLTFYQTSAGQAVINKMPALMQQTMVEVQKLTSGIVPELQKVQKQFAAEMASASE